MSSMKFMKNRIVKASMWYTATEFFVKGLAFLTIPIYTRLLTTQDYGLASLYATWVSILTIIVGLSLNTSITKAKYDYKNEYDNYVASIMSFSFIIFFCCLLLFILLRNILENLTGFNTWILLFMLFQAYFTFVKTSLIAKFRVEYNYKKISIISILINLFGVALSIFLITSVFKEQSYLGKILGNGVLIVVFGMMFLIYMIRAGGGINVNKKYWKYALVLSLPLIFHSLSNLINAQFDRIIIDYYIDESATGLYSFAYNVGMIITVLTYSLDQAWAPWVYEMLEKGRFTIIKSRAKIYRDFYTVAYTILLFLSPELIRIMADQSYWESLVIIPYIFAGYYLSFMYTLEVKTEFFYKKTNLISVGTVLSATINILLNLIFVPKYGYVAAAATTTISFFFLFVFHYLITSKLMKKVVYGFKFHFRSLLYMMVITFYFVLFDENLLIRIIGIIVTIIIGYWSVSNKYKRLSKLEDE